MKRDDKKYNVRMIRDFLEHLMWELRIVHFEVSQTKGTGRPPINPELLSQLNKYMDKYGCGLLYVSQPDQDQWNSMTPDEQLKVAAHYRGYRAAEMQFCIDTLEKIQPLFNEAFSAASKPRGELGIRVVQVGELLERIKRMEEGGEGCNDEVKIRAIRLAITGALMHPMGDVTTARPPLPDIRDLKNKPAWRRYLMATGAIVNNIRDSEDMPKAIARHIELLEDVEKERLIDEALAIYP